MLDDLKSPKILTELNRYHPQSKVSEASIALKKFDRIKLVSMDLVIPTMSKQTYNYIII